MIIRALLCFSFPLLPALAASAQQSAPAQQSTPAQPIALRSGRVYACKVDKGCAEENVNGRKMLAMEADGYTIKVAIAENARYSHADITIVNNSGYPVQIIPSDFRMEVEAPRLQRLSYVNPDRVAEPRAKPVPQEKEPDPDRGHGLPPPSYWGSQQAAQDKQDRLEEIQPRKEQTALQAQVKSSGATLLKAGPLAPSATATGRVYFQRSKTDTDMNLFVPISGTTFEFPYTVPPKKAKKLKKGEVKS